MVQTRGIQNTPVSLKTWKEVINRRAGPMIEMQQSHLWVWCWMVESKKSWISSYWFQVSSTVDRCAKTVIRNGSPPSHGIQSSSWDSKVSKKISVCEHKRGHTALMKLVDFSSLTLHDQNQHVGTELQCCAQWQHLSLHEAWGLALTARFAQWSLIKHHYLLWFICLVKIACNLIAIWMHLKSKFP